jgi:hypothetical protein
MAFVLDLSPTYSREVSWKVAGDSPSTPVEIKFTARFHRLDVKQIRDVFVEFWRASGQQDELTEEEKTRRPRTDREIVDVILGGWGDISDPQGKPVPFDEGSRDKVLGIKGALEAIIAKWVASLDVEGEAKNSQVPPNTGQPAVSEQQPSTAPTPSPQPQPSV